MFINKKKIEIESIEKINKICLNSTNEYCKKILKEHEKNKKNKKNEKNIYPVKLDLIKLDLINNDENFTSSNYVIPIFCFISVTTFLTYLYNKK